MATIRPLRGRWQAMVRRKGMAPRAKSFDKKNVAERWARELEAELDRCGALPDTRVAESMTLNQLLTRYRDEVSPKKRSGASEVDRINGILRRPICYRTLTLLSSQDVATYRDQRLKEAAPRLPRCSPRANRRINGQDSNCNWMKLQGQIKSFP